MWDNYQGDKMDRQSPKTIMKEKIKSFRVFHLSDISKARRFAKELIQPIGFGVVQSEEVGLVVSELASNLVRHAKGGKLILKLIQNNSRIGIEIESFDMGPGIMNIEEAISDGYSTTGSLGYGLGTVLRLTDEFDVRSNHQEWKGTRILCQKWKKEEFSNVLSCPLEFGIATRPHYKMSVNGDGFVIKRWEKSGLAAVIDGLGHGAHAHRASQTARQYIETHYEQPLFDIFRGVGCVCRSTRGVVMAIAQFDCCHNRLSYASLGNVEGYLISLPKPMHLMARRGIIGVSPRIPAISESQWKPGDMLIIYTDGLSAHWHWSEFSKLDKKSAATIAKHLMDKLGKQEDDATIVVVRYIVE